MAHDAEVPIGSKWKNKRSGNISEVVSYDKTERMVYFRVGKTGRRGKYLPHLLLDYERVEN